jgi:hypothetical protein
MRRPFGHFSLILGTAFLFGCPSDDTGGNDGTTGEPTTTNPTASTSMSGTSPSTTDSSTTVEPETDSSGSDSGSDSGSSGSESGSSGSGSGSSSGTAGGAGDLVINFTGYPHDGLDLNLKVFAEDDTELEEATGVITGTALTLTVPGVIEEGMNYSIRWWVDLSADGVCDSDVEHMWELTGQAGTASGLSIDHDHSESQTNVCAYWRR